MSIFRLHACCIVVKGARRAIIYDLQREEFHYIPLSLYEILSNDESINIESIKSTYDRDDEYIIDEYFNMLIVNDYGFYCDNPENFPPIDFAFDTPEVINNAIIDIDATSNHDFDRIFNQLSILRCKYLEIRFFTDYNLDRLKSILKLSYNSSIKNIDIYIKYDADYTEFDFYEKILFPNLVVGHIFVHSSPFNKTYSTDDLYRLIFTKQQIVDESCCGNIFLEEFTTNIKLFSESKVYNSCLHKKISIDSNGQIKNCPSMKKSFGDHRSVDFKSIVEHSIFTELWNVNKDQIDVCKDCEYRYMCTDCRAFLNSPYDKPKKCNYDPYTATWN